ncbi:MAG TPA: type 2 lanthipeptide synthetase LanM [Acidimicrobiales bacterium]|nr:type 2 lanthipeptide synthetase LanM [Acidimicrobiales bacterium]
MDTTWDDDLDREVAFASLFRPWVDEAARQLRVPEVIGPAARRSLVRSLLERLSFNGSLAALERFRSTEVDYQSFTRTGLAPLGDAYPGLVALADRLRDQWVVATQVLVDRIAADLGHVAPGTTEAVDVHPRLGDPHRGAHHVAAVLTDRGDRLYLKPRSIAPESTFFEIVAGSPGLVPQEDVPRLWVADGYGWMSEVTTGPVTDRATYWFDVGRMLRMLQVCGATDLHQSNVICTGSQIVPVDLECLAAPELIAHSDLTDDVTGWFLRDSVTPTGLLPRTAASDGPVAVDWSGLVGRAGQLNGRWRPRWVGLGTDAIRREKAPMRTPRGANLALDPDGDPVALDLGALLRGYDEEYGRWTTDTLPVDALAGVPARVLFRPTAVYANVLADLMDPTVLADPRALEVVADRLGPLPEGLAAALGPDGTAAVEASERAALRRLDIPIFHVDADTLVLDDGTRRPMAQGRTGRERIVARLERVDDAAWRRADRALVQVALEPAAPAASRAEAAPAHAPASPEPVLPDPAAVLHVVRAIAADLADEAVDLGGGRVGWAEAVPEGAAGRLRVALAPRGIYHGAPGIALFLAAVAAATGDDGAADLARRALLDRPGDDDGPWYQTGWSGWAWAAAHAGALLGDDELTANAVDVVVGRLPDEIPDGEPLDLVGGWAGPVAAAAGVARCTGDGAATERAVAAGTALGHAVRVRLADEIAARDVLRLGMAHGSTGILHALGSAVALGSTGTDDTAEVIARLRDLEDERVARRGGIGGRIDQPRGQRVPSRTWCWGVSGYLVARAAAHVGDPGPTDALTASFAALATGPSPHGHLCCGLAGHLDAALAARDLGLTGADAVIADRVERLATTAHGAPFHDATTFSSPSVFRGRAGVGLALLRATVDPALPTPLAP